MAELEKVKTGLECCAIGAECDHCPYAQMNEDKHDFTGCHQLHWDALELLKEQHSISVDMFIQWCVDSQIMGEATRNGLKYWVDKFKEWNSLKDGDGE